MRRKGQEKRSSSEAPYIPPVSPHILFFAIYNSIYYFPLLLAFIWGYGEGGVETALNFTTNTMIKITVIYLAGFLAFVTGAKFSSILQYLGARKLSRFRKSSGLTLSLSDMVAVAILCIIFIFSKILLIPLGVYQQYAFDTDQMTGGAWSFSMACSESLLFVSILVLFSKYRHRVIAFGALTLLNGANLLHGTRVFFIIAILALSFYAYARGHLPIRRLIVAAPVAFTAVLGVTYIVFLKRATSTSQGLFSLSKLASPLVYESVFSQLSLVNAINHVEIWASGGGLRFFSDAFLNSLPRILAPDKDNLTFIGKYSYLSPMGAFNGYAQGLMYFGIFFPGLYFVFGLIAGWLHKKAKTSGWWLTLYVYFTADFLFRIMRDGYLIPIKMIINAVQIVCFLILFRLLIQSPRMTVLEERVS
jgi:hypothetical protein